MKFNKLNAGVVSCLLAVAISGCDKNDSNKAADDMKKSADGTATAVQQSTEKVVTEVKPVAENAAAEVKPVVEQAKTAVAQQVQPAANEVMPVITKAQGEVTEKKYKEALTTLATLKDVKLTDSQQKLVDELKAQAQKLMSGDAGKAIGNLLGK